MLVRVVAWENKDSGTSAGTAHYSLEHQAILNNCIKVRYGDLCTNKTRLILTIAITTMTFVPPENKQVDNHIW